MGEEIIKQPAARKKRRRKKSRKQVMIAYAMRAACVLAAVLLCIGLIFAVRGIAGGIRARKNRNKITPSYVKENVLTVNSYSRPAISTGVTKGVVIHSYTAESEKMTAGDRRNYFESLKDGSGERESRHFVVGLKGEAVMCVPMDEIAYASDDKNTETVSVEFLCGEDGLPTEEAYENLVDLIAWICVQRNVTWDHVIRHYDATGKSCPEAYVKNEENWNKLISDVRTAIVHKKSEKNITE